MAGFWRRGQALIFSGRPLDGVRDLQTSLRLEPSGVNLAHRLTLVAEGHYFSRAYDEALEAAKHVIRSFPDFPPPYRSLARPRKRLHRSLMPEQFAADSSLEETGFEPSVPPLFPL